MSLSASKIRRFIGKHIANRYAVTGEIGRGGMGYVFSAIPFEDPSKEVAIKIILQAKKKLGSENIARFQKEASFMAKLHHPNVVSFYELGWIDGFLSEGDHPLAHAGYFIVMERINGIDLKTLLAQKHRLDIDEFHKISLQLAQALDYTHSKNIVHRDIKPQNIVIDRLKQVKILDFGVASLTDALQAGGKDPIKTAAAEVAGTPLYMAPEQLINLQNLPDHRSDLYSLGCVLYEMLAGHTPFQGDNRENLAKMHASVLPKPLSNIRPDLPPVLVSIVHRLLEKEIDYRYSTAFSLYTDLLKSQQLMLTEKRSHAIRFPLGRNDQFQSITTRIPYIDNSGFLKSSLDLIEEIKLEKGRSQIIAMHSHAGTGKTRYLNELKQNLIAKKIPFINITFSKHELDLDYNAIANGFNEYLLRVIKYQPFEAEELRSKIHSILGDSALHLVRVISTIEYFIKDRKISILDDDSDKIDFKVAFSNFVKCLSFENNPFLFVLDDVHWADDKTLELIDHFFTFNNSQKFLLTLTYREELLRTNHTLEKFIEKMGKLRRRFHSFNLPDLSRENSRTLTRSLLSQHEDESLDNKFYEYVFNTSKGNPTFIIEILKEKIAEESLFYDQNEWSCNLRDLTEKTTTVKSLELVLINLARIDQVSLKIIQYASVLGQKFSYHAFTYGQMFTPEEVSSAIIQAKSYGILREHEQMLEFTHWNAREQIYQSTPLEQKLRFHRCLFHNNRHSQSTESSSREIYEIAKHANFVLANEGELISGEDRLCIAKINFRAGKEAYKSSAWPSAQRYFENTIRTIILNPELVKKEKQLLSYCYEKLGDTMAAQRKNAESIQAFRESLNHQDLDSLQHILKLQVKISQICMQAGMITEGIKTSQQAMSRFSSWKDFLIHFLAKAQLLYHFFYPSAKSHPTIKLAKSIYLLFKSRPQKVKDDPYDRAVVLHKLAANFIHTDQYHDLIDRGYFYASINPKPLPLYLDILLSRIIRLSQLGRYTFFKDLFNLVLSVQKSIGLNDDYARNQLLKLMHFDYKDHRFDNFDALFITFDRYLEKTNNLLLIADIITLKSFWDLLRGNVHAFEKNIVSIQDNIQTRHFLSARAMAMNLFGLMLLEKRDQVMIYAELYLKRRNKVGARSNDPFAIIIDLLNQLCLGQIHKNPALIEDQIKIIFQPAENRADLRPFETDFIYLFQWYLIIVHPQIVTQKMIKAHSSRTPRSLVADLYEIARKTKEQPKRHSAKEFREAFAKARLITRAFKLPLIDSIGSHWLASLNPRTNEQRKPLKDLDELRLLRESPYTFYSQTSKKTSAIDNKALGQISQRNEAPFSPFKTPLLKDLVGILTKVQEGHTTLPKSLPFVLEVIDRHLKCQRITLLLFDKGKSVFQLSYPSAPESDSIEDYISPYIGLQSTLFLPSSDTPWGANFSGMGQEMHHDRAYTQKAKISAVLRGPVEDLEKTVAFGSSPTHPASMLGSSMTQIATINRSLPSMSESALSQQSLSMSAIIPLRNESVSGILFLEEVDQGGPITTGLRFELNHLSAILSRFLGYDEFQKLFFSDVQRRRLFSTLDSNASYDDALTGLKTPQSFLQGACQIESCPWLGVYFQGPLRSKRESIWYLGYNLNDQQYLLFYSRINGDLTSSQTLGRMLWYHCHAFKNNTFEDAESAFSSIKSVLRHIIIHEPKFLTMEAVSLNFTIFQKSTKKILATHFGPSRPFVFASNNMIRPDNEILGRFENGRELRSWSLQAGMDDFHLYINAHDTSRLDVKLPQSGKELLASALSEDLHSTVGKTEMPKTDFGSQERVRRALNEIFMENFLPRYFLLFWNREAIENWKNQLSKQKRAS